MDRQLFLSWLTRRGLSNKTVKDYIYWWGRFKGEFNQENINAFLEQHQNIKSKSPIYAFLNNYKEFLIEIHPSIFEYQKIRIPKRRGRKERKLPDFPTEKEVLEIEKFCLSEREQIMLLISFYSALRPQGMLNLNLDAFNINVWKLDESRPCQLRVTEKGGKERIVLISTPVMKRLKAYCQRNNIGKSRNLWGIGYRRWHTLLTNASKKALGRSLSPHKLRHGGATWLLQHGWSLQELSEFLGHESISTTQIYAHLDKQKMQEKYADLFI